MAQKQWEKGKHLHDALVAAQLALKINHDSLTVQMELAKAKVALAKFQAKQIEWAMEINARENWLKFDGQCSKLVVGSFKQ